MKIVNRLMLGFSLILIGVLVLGVMGVRGVVQLSTMTTDIFEHPFRVSTAILTLRADILAEQLDLTRLAYSPSAAQVERVQRTSLEHSAHIDENLASVQESFLGNKGEVAQIKKALAEFRAARDETMALVKSGRATEAIALNNGRVAMLVQDLLKEAGDVLEYAAAKAPELKLAAEHERDVAMGIIAVLLVLIVAGGIATTLLITRSVRLSLKLATAEIQDLIKGGAEKARTADAIGAGDLSREIHLSEPMQIDVEDLPKDEVGVLINTAVHLSEVQYAFDEAFQKMTLSLRLARDRERDRDWLKSGRNELHSAMREEQSSAEMADKLLTFLVEYLHAGVGALYLFDEHIVKLTLTATYAVKKTPRLGDQFRLGEGLIGQAAREQKIICLSDVPPNYLPIGSALGESPPALIAAVPLLHGNRLVGVIEIGAFREFSEFEMKFLEVARETIAIGLDASLSRQRMAELLQESQQLTEELRVQQEELQQSNEELEERAQLLEQQREAIRAKNLEIEAASERLLHKAEELERVSTYKSEFLANMSHELRTPLNSLMILSGLLMQNKDGNLSDKQVEFAATINGAGKDLLNLINDILDLSKVEAGQMQFHSAEMSIPDLCAALRALFEPLAEQKKLAFRVDVDASVPPRFHGDQQRVQQILKNLLANALKFTKHGQVALRVACPDEPENPLPVPAISFAIADTGIGVSP
ncbi:MAG: histidine kinase dimerization/phospho-acceptor domain-containing protein, partial [Sterolibacterium sp.]